MAGCISVAPWIVEVVEREYSVAHSFFGMNRNSLARAFRCLRVYPGFALPLLHAQVTANALSCCSNAELAERAACSSGLLRPHQSPLRSDYYDFLNLGAGRMGIVLADNVGKVIPGALLMANLQADVRSQ